MYRSGNGMMPNPMDQNYQQQMNAMRMNPDLRQKALQQNGLRKYVNKPRKSTFVHTPGALNFSISYKTY